MAATGNTNVKLRIVNRIDDVLARVHRYAEYQARVQQMQAIESFAVAIGARPLMTGRDGAELLKRAANDDAFNAVLWALEGADG